MMSSILSIARNNQFSHSVSVLGPSEILSTSVLDRVVSSALSDGGWLLFHGVERFSQETKDLLARSLAPLVESSSSPITVHPDCRVFFFVDDNLDQRGDVDVLDALCLLPPSLWLNTLKIRREQSLALPAYRDTQSHPLDLQSRRRLLSHLFALFMLL